MDLFTRLATVQPVFAQAVQQAHGALEANPYNGTAFGSMVVAEVDPLSAGW